MVRTIIAEARGWAPICARQRDATSELSSSFEECVSEVIGTCCVASCMRQVWGRCIGNEIFQPRRTQDVFRWFENFTTEI